MIEHHPRITRWFWFVALCLLAAVMLLPFAWILSSSLRPSGVMKVYDDKWYANWVPGEEHIEIELDGQMLAVKPLEMVGTQQKARILQTGPLHERVVTLPKSGLKETNVAVLEEVLPQEDPFLAQLGKGGVGEMRFFYPPDASPRTAVKDVPPRIDNSKMLCYLFWEEDFRWVRAEVTAREGETITFRLSDEHPRFGEEVLVDPAVIQTAWEMKFAWSNYSRAWMAVDLGRAYINSILVGLAVTFFQVFTSSLAAFSFSRLQWRGRDTVFFAYIATMMVPAAVTMIPLYVLFARGPMMADSMFGSEIFTSDYWLFGDWQVGRLIGIDSYLALILPACFSAYGTFLLRQFFLGIPRDLEDAARIDGCGSWGVYWNVVLPLSRPALAALAIFTFVANWKSFMWPLIIAQSDALQTLPVTLAHFQGKYNTEYSLLMAGAVLALIPLVFVFLFGQRQFIAGIRMGALKG